jgi:hypothetical protein
MTMREWTIDLCSFTVEAETEEGARLQAIGHLSDGGEGEIDCIIKGAVVDPQPACHVGAEGCYCREVDVRDIPHT